MAKTIGIFTGEYGHASIAEAIKEKIEQQTKKYKVKIFIDKNPAVHLIYDPFYKFFPGSSNSPASLLSKLSQKDSFSRKLIDMLLIFNYEKNIRHFVKKNKVNLLISTAQNYNPILEKLQDKNLPFIDVLPDPKTVVDLDLAEKADAQIVFDNYLVKKYKHTNMLPAGWFVRSKFEADYDQATIRRQLKINSNLTVLIVSGSEGSNTVLKILPTIINCDKPVNFIIACGNNDFLYHNILGIKQSLTQFSSSKASITALAFTKNLHLYMQASDLIIGKAGPNTLFESVACGKPFFAITHISGQEDGNLDIIRDYKIGIVEENAKKANRRLAEIIRNPAKLRAFDNGIKKLKKYNQKSIGTLLQEIERLIGP